jgi:hypothetical protein|tara:strand:+ start:317 stop:565 length:249 start_codon:yes stop_codon:yes gene_type:complete
MKIDNKDGTHYYHELNLWNSSIEGYELVETFGRILTQDELEDLEHYVESHCHMNGLVRGIIRQGMNEVKDKFIKEVLNDEVG